jgi:DNA-directed RNA polymerase beta' subunit
MELIKKEKKFYTSYSKLSEVKLITIGLASPERIKQWAEKTLPNGKILGEVINANTLHHKTFKPQKGGLFCERIFGPLKDFECACGKPLKYKKEAKVSNVISNLPDYSNFKEVNIMSTELNANKSICCPAGEILTKTRNFCNTCEVEYTWSVMRRYQLGYIRLISPVTHVWYLKGNPSYLSILLDIKKKHLENITYCTETITLENALKGGTVSSKSSDIVSSWKKLKEQIIFYGEAKYAKKTILVTEEGQKEQDLKNQLNQTDSQILAGRQYPAADFLPKADTALEKNVSTVKSFRTILSVMENKIEKRAKLKLKKYKYWKIFYFFKNANQALESVIPNEIANIKENITQADINEYKKGFIFTKDIKQSNKNYYSFLVKPGINEIKNYSKKINFKKVHFLSFLITQTKRDTASVTTTVKKIKQILKKITIPFYILLNLNIFSQKSIYNNVINSTWKKLTEKALRKALIRINKICNKMDSAYAISFNNFAYPPLSFSSRPLESKKRLNPTNKNSQKFENELKEVWEHLNRGAVRQSPCQGSFLAPPLKKKFNTEKINFMAEPSTLKNNFTTKFIEQNSLKEYLLNSSRNSIKSIKNYFNSLFYVDYYKIDDLKYATGKRLSYKVKDPALFIKSHFYLESYTLSNFSMKLSEFLISYFLKKDALHIIRLNYYNIIVRNLNKIFFNIFLQNLVPTFTDSVLKLQNSKESSKKNKNVLKLHQNLIYFFMAQPNMLKKKKKFEFLNQITNWPSSSMTQNKISKKDLAYAIKFKNSYGGTGLAKYTKTAFAYAESTSQKAESAAFEFDFINANIFNKIFKNDLLYKSSNQRSYGMDSKSTLIPNVTSGLKQDGKVHQLLKDSTRKKKLYNNIYCLSHRERWEVENDWNFLYYFMTAPSENGEKMIPNYKDRYENGYGTNFAGREYNPTLTYQNISFNLEKSAFFSGPGIVQQLLNEFNFNELRTMDKQNRFLHYFLNKKIIKLKNNTSNKRYRVKDKELKELKELYKKRDLLIRRTKLVRKFLRKESSPQSTILTMLPVLPPDLRPIVKMGDQIAASDLNRLYQRVIYRNDRLKKFLKDPATSHSYEMKYAQRLLQEAVDNLIQNGKSGVVSEKDSRGRALKSLSDILKGKQGRFRQYLLGKRVDYSGRSVIVVGPKLKLHECGIPKEMALELYLPFLLKTILNENLARTVVGAKTLIKTNPTLIWELLREIMQTCPVLLNRAPTLHRLGIQAFQPKLIDGRAILLHPLVCAAFNADFDGDQMAVHVPITVEARAEAWKLMLSRNNILSPATGDPLAIPSQDMVLGCYYLTTNLLNSLAANANKGDNINLLNIKGSGFYFSNIEDVLKDYELKKIDLHSNIWLKWNGFLENGSDQEEPIEIRLDSLGNWKEIYNKSQKSYDSKNSLISQYILTTPGKILFNQIIQKSIY